MALLTISIGSNIEPESHVRLAVKLLRCKFPNLLCSPVYESETVGFDGENFLNLVAAVETDLELGELATYLKKLEDDLGRDRSQPTFSGRTMDLDILTLGDLCGEFDGIELPRKEILEHAFVLQPLADLLPGQLHPVTGRSFREHWKAFSNPGQKLWPVEFDWQQERGSIKVIA